MKRDRVRVGLDAQLLSTKDDYRAAGVSHYIYYMAQELPRIDAGLDYTAYLSDQHPDLPRAIRQIPARWPTHLAPVRILWEQCLAPFLVRRDKINLWHSMVNVQPLWLPIPSLTTIQDLTFWVYPERFRWPNRVYNRLFVRWSAQRATQIIVTSQSTKKDIIRYWDIAPDRISVTHLAQGDEFRPLEDTAALREFRRRKGLPDRFLLYIGTIEPRKNLERLIRAYAHLAQSGNLPHHLVIGGGKGWMYDRIDALVRELGLQDRVHFPGFVPQDEMVWWYNSAEVMVYPSLYEGFGLPPLEAMACGTPVVTSNVSSLPEIVGNGALTVNPHAVDELTEAIHRLTSDATLREQQRHLGLERAKGFSWADTARRTVSIYRRALQGSHDV